MNKLGLAIKSTSAGSGQPTVINNGDWTRRVIDVRDVLKHVDNIVNDYNKVVTFLSFDENGSFVTVSRTISGRAYDNVSAWLYIPNELLISGKEIVELVNKLSTLIMSPEMPDTRTLQELVAKEYEVKRASLKIQASSKEGIVAQRNNAVYSFEELLGIYRYQRIYSNYSFIFLVNVIGQNKVTINDAVDLSGEKPEHIISFMPPLIKSIQDTFGKSVTIETRTGQVFDRPILALANSTIQLVAKREGFDSIPFNVTPTTDCQTCELPADKAIWKKTIKRSDFKVISESGKDLPMAKIQVNHQDLTSTLVINDNDCANAIVTVNSNGYDTFNHPVNLLTSGAHTIKLIRKIEEVSWNIQLDHGAHATVTLADKAVNKYMSPIQGYAYDSKTRGLVYSPWKERIIGFAAAIVLVLIILFIKWWTSVRFESNDGFPWFKIVSIEQTTTVVEENETTDEGVDYDFDTQAPSESELAIKYLDSSRSWSKDSIDKYPTLNGLYEDLNSYAFDNIITREETLNSSQNFSELLAKVKENRDKQFNNAKYSTSNQPINIDNYIEKISKPAILNEVSKQPQTKDNSTKDKPNSVSAKKSQSAGNPAGTKPNKGGGARGDGEL